MEKVHIYILDTKTKANNAVKWMNDKMVEHVEGYSNPVWFVPVQIPPTAPPLYAGRWFIKLPYKLRHSKYWNKLKDHITSLNAYNPDRHKSVDVDLFRGYMGYDQDI